MDNKIKEINKQIELIQKWAHIKGGIEESRKEIKNLLQELNLIKINANVERLGLVDKFIRWREYPPDEGPDIKREYPVINW